MIKYGSIKQYVWIFILPLAFFVYSNSFNTFPIIEQSVDVLGSSDAVNFQILIKDFHLEKKYGNPYNKVNRNFGDIAQKHKIHHLLYVMVGSLIYKTLSVLYGLFGVSANQASYSVNALLSCFNLLLLAILLRYFNAGRGNTALLLFLYAFSLSTWIFSSVPGSWIFTTTLILLFLVLWYRFKCGPLVMSFFIGIAMLGNIFLFSLLIFLFIRYLLSAQSAKELARKTVLSSLVASATWIGLLSLLSLFDDSLRPDNFIRYTFWFKDFVADKLPFYSPYAWKVILSNLFVNSIVSNQPNPEVPLEALLYTLKGSPLGLITTLIYFGLCTVVLLRIFASLRGMAARHDVLRTMLGREEFHIISYCFVWILLTWIVFPPGAFVYSTTTVPLVMILIHRFVSIEKLSHRVLLYATVIMVTLNNIDQILKFRWALSALSAKIGCL